MRLSCNGCRVLRKGCSDNCSIRPCLDWIKSPDSQANATLFLAKFYGRAGLLSLINAGPSHLRPSIFRSLLHEACGRIVNPVHGSAGLFSTGSWELCQAAVEAVLSGSPISQVSMDSGADHVSSLFKACDIRHLSKQEKRSELATRLKRPRTRFKRCAGKSVVKPKVEADELYTESSSGDSMDCVQCGGSKASRSGSSELGSAETVEDTLGKPNGLRGVGPELRLGLSLFPILEAQKEEAVEKEEVNGCDEATLTCDLTLGLSYVNKNSFGTCGVT